MPLKTKKSPAKKKPVSKSVKAKAKPKAKLQMAAKGESIFRKILEERKHLKGPPQPYKTDHRGQHSSASRHEQFAKFAGPKRRAA